MFYHDKSNFELKQWREYCRNRERAATNPLGHLSGRADSNRVAQESREEIRKIDSELRSRREG